MPASGRVRNGDRAHRSRIHEGLVGARELIGTPYLADPVLRAEYEREIAPRTRVALAKILGEVFPHPRGPGRPRRAVDLGAGTGAASAALRAHFGDELDLRAVDRVVATGHVLPVDITDIGALSRLTAGSAPFDLAVAAHVLNELFVDREPADRVERLGRLVSSWCEVVLHEGGTMILLEPALRETSRVLLAVRDHLLGMGFDVIAPCFFTGPCPALIRERDWCHDSAARGAGRVDFSYLVVRASGEASADPALCRIVSDPLPEKGRLKLFACGSGGRHPLVRLDRHASPSNAAIEELVRGDTARILRVAFAQDGLRVVKETIVTRDTAPATAAGPAPDRPSRRGL